MKIVIPSGEFCHQNCKFMDEHFDWCKLFNIKLERTYVFEFSKYKQCKEKEKVEIVYE